MGDAVVRLRDGRQLGYATYGDPGGFPVLSCHGGLLCRLDASPVDEVARELGLRVISPDRPGVGLSDRWPGHSTLDWAFDAEQLLDQLGVDRFACTGWSMGGQHCAAVSFRMADRVTRAVIVAGCLPLDEPGLLEQLSRTDRVLGRLSVKSPRAARAAFVTLRLGARFLERRQGLPERALAEGLRNASGVVDEYRAFLSPWGFRLEDVQVRTEVWQGTADELVPPAWATEIVRRVPSSTLVTLEGQGHMIGITHRSDVLRHLIEDADAP
ncbi:MAG: putative alpha/beta hydrolase [Thermoleophilia bacterium]|nr:putative alpha/beta hydrolase [Thermoleophilia bacterium]